jgi:6,7-dimethyl-8-ribityllumazine synthase
VALKNKNLSQFDTTQVPDASAFCFGIVTSEWNPEITDALFKGAKETLLQFNVKEENIFSITVPGSYELTAGAHFLLQHYKLDAVICLGCVIQGETRHFDFICNAVANGLTELSIKAARPVIFGVLTTNTIEQAQERAGGKHGNKGIEAAITAIKMAALKMQIQQKKVGF